MYLIQDLSIRRYKGTIWRVLGSYQWFLFLFILYSVHSSSRGRSDPQRVRKRADGATAELPKRQSWPGADAPRRHSRSFTFSALRQTPCTCDTSTSLCVLTPGAVCVPPAGCGGGVAATTFRWDWRRIVTGTRAPSSAAAQQQPGCHHRLCRDGNGFLQTLIFPAFTVKRQAASVPHWL